MARAGVTYQDVINAAQELDAQGKNPTIEMIRILIGSGSNSTISQHLRTWKSKKNNSISLLCAKDNLPDEFVILMKGLWERVLAEAEDKLTIAEQDFQKSLAETNEKLNKLQDENTHWEENHRDLQAKYYKLDAEKELLAIDVRQLKDKNISLNAIQDTINQQFQERQNRITELNRLNQQIQANLEHYREASREQRLLDKQRHEKVQGQAELTIQELRKDLKILNEQNKIIQNECEQIRNINNGIQGQYDQLVIQSESIKSRLHQAEKDINRHASAEQHWNEQYHKVLEKADNQTTTIITLEKQAAVLTQKFSDLQGELQKTTEQNKFFSHEKWILEQENAQLTGQLKQLGKLEVA